MHFFGGKREQLQQLRVWLQEWRVENRFLKYYGERQEALTVDLTWRVKERTESKRTPKFQAWIRKRIREQGITRLQGKSVICILTSVLLGSLGRLTQPSFHGQKMTDPLCLWPPSCSDAPRNSWEFPWAIDIECSVGIRIRFLHKINDKNDSENIGNYQSPLYIAISPLPLQKHLEIFFDQIPSLYEVLLALFLLFKAYTFFKALLQSHILALIAPLDSSGTLCVLHFSVGFSFSPSQTKARQGIRSQTFSHYCVISSIRS